MRTFFINLQLFELSFLLLIIQVEHKQISLVHLNMSTLDTSPQTTQVVLWG
jgi:hypothetical protein